MAGCDLPHWRGISQPRGCIPFWKLHFQAPKASVRERTVSWLFSGGEEVAMVSAWKTQQCLAPSCAGNFPCRQGVAVYESVW